VEEVALPREERPAGEAVVGRAVLLVERHGSRRVISGG
jgi:hypothetical protein